MLYQYTYFIGCIICLIVWLLLYIKRKDLRKEMIFGSLLGVPFGLSEFLFVPEYWNPPSLFNLINKIGFGIESLLFGFCIGGIASILYEFINKKKLKKVRKYKQSDFAPYLIFAILFLGLEIILPEKSIYNLSISLIIMAIIIALLRKDLIKQIMFSGFLFATLYFIFCLTLKLLFEEFLYQYYNLNNLLNIKLLGIPIEEIIFGFAVGAAWSTLYEYIKGYKTKSISFLSRI